MPRPTRTLNDFIGLFNERPELFPKTDPHGGFFTEAELAKRWRLQESTIQAWRLSCNKKLAPYFNLGTGAKAVPLYPKMFVFFMEQERMVR